MLRALLHSTFRAAPIENYLAGSLLLVPSKQEHEQGGDALSVAEVARGNEFGYLICRNADEFNISGIFSYETRGHEVGNHKTVEILGAIAWCGIKPAQSIYLPREIADLLLQFAAYRLKRIFAGIDATRRNFEEKLAHSMPELANQNDTALFIKGYGCYGIAMLYDLSGRLCAAGFFNRIHAYGYSAATIDLLAR